MKRASCVAVCVLAFSSVMVFAQDPTQIEAGEMLYDEHCAMCHGDLTQMTVAERVVDHTMGFCIDCHKQRGASNDCLTCHY